MRSHARLMLLCTIPVVPACAPGAGDVDSWSLQGSLFSAGRFELVAPEGPLAERAHGLAEFLERRTSFDARVRTVDGPARADRGAVRILLGTTDDPEVMGLLARFGIERAQGGFRVLGLVHDSPGDALTLVAADPERPGRPLVVFAGNDAELFVRGIRAIPAPWVPRLTTRRRGVLGLDVRLSTAGEPRLDTLVGGVREEHEEFHLDPASTGELRFHVAAGVETPVWEAHRRACLEAAGRVRTWFEGGELDRALDVFVHADVEAFRRATGELSLGLVDASTLRVDLLTHPDLPVDGGEAVARALALALAGEPGHSWFADGVGVAAAETYWGWPLDDWVRLVGSAGLVPDPTRLLRPDAALNESVHVVRPLRGWLIRLAIGRDPEALAHSWSGAELLKLRRPRVPRGPLPVERRDERAARRQRAATTELRGVAMWAAPGVGYATDSAAAELAAAHAAGANAFTLTVLAGTDPRQPMLAPDRGVFGSAGDLELAALLAEGRGLGMIGILSLEPMRAPFGSRLDDGPSLVLPEHIEEFFDTYERILVHYALVAELVRADSFALGVGLELASITRPTNMDPPGIAQTVPARSERWSRLIALARALYGGALTYVADTRGESIRVGFWNELDAIGLIGFGPLDPEAAHDEEEILKSLRIEFGHAEDLTENFYRPAFFAQAGYPARSGSLADPLLPLGAIDAGAQQRYYSALARIHEERAGREPPIGLILWNWSTDRTRLAPGGFSPQGTSAEDLLGRLFAPSF